MNRFLSRLIAFSLILILTAGLIPSSVLASDATDDAVLAVITQLEAIDTLQQMQDKRSEYAVSSRYNVDTTDTAVIAAHEAARTGYESYVGEMFVARIAAQQAYNALTAEQQSQIDPELAAKLSNELSTTYSPFTVNITPADNEYTYEAVDGFGRAYEVGNHMVSGNIPQTFMLADTSGSATEWTPNGLYVYGESNYDVAYCCDVLTNLEKRTHYKRLNLEDSDYYGVSASQHIRAILQNAYPFVTMEEMKASLVAGGMDPAFVDSLTRADLISAVQMAVWTYANAADGAQNGLGYFATIDVPKNNGIYFTAFHDYTNELWDWLPGKKGTTYDALAEYRVNTLAYYLCTLPGVPAGQDEIVISDIEITRADLLPGADDTYSVGMYIHLNHGGTDQDDLKVIVSSYHTNEDGSVTLTARTKQVLGSRSTVDMYIKAKSGDTISVVVEGTQRLARGVYFYEPEGGRDVSQCLVGVAEGETPVRVEKTFAFAEEIGDMGLRIHKAQTGTGLPLSDITFHIYRVVPGKGDTVSSTPTSEEIAKYQTSDNLVGSISTDITGYADIALVEGIYLIVEEHNTAKVKAPVDPFYIFIPMTQSFENEDGSTRTETVDILEIYPKNEPVIPPEVPPVIPPVPENVTGSFQILKHDALDSAEVLAGAKFEVYRTATAEDTGTEIILHNGVQYAVVPVYVGGSPLTLTTNENGTATSPLLPCGTYFLIEVEAPDGYMLPDQAFSVTVVSSAMTSVSTVLIPNTAGHLLPETGGAGTSWFLITGSILTLGALVLLITKKRMASE